MPVSSGITDRDVYNVSLGKARVMATFYTRTIWSVNTLPSSKA
jgi:hypothetical protein